MKSRIFFIVILTVGFFVANTAMAKDEVRDLPPFTKISLKISGKVYLEQGNTQSVKIVAEDETLEEIITEVKDRTLSIRFPNSNMFRNWNPGKIEIYITIPGIDALTVSGSGDIFSKAVNSRIIDLAVSGSGNIDIDNLSGEQVSAAISGSGNINASEFEAERVDVQTSGSGNCSVMSNGEIKARISGSGNVNYSGNPAIDSAVSGSGKVKKR